VGLAGHGHAAKVAVPRAVHTGDGVVRLVPAVVMGGVDDLVGDGERNAIGGDTLQVLRPTILGEGRARGILRVGGTALDDDEPVRAEGQQRIAGLRGRLRYVCGAVVQAVAGTPVGVVHVGGAVGGPPVCARGGRRR